MLTIKDLEKSSIKLARTMTLEEPAGYIYHVNNLFSKEYSVVLNLMCSNIPDFNKNNIFFEPSLIQKLSDSAVLALATERKTAYLDNTTKGLCEYCKINTGKAEFLIPECNLLFLKMLLGATFAFYANSNFFQVKTLEKQEKYLENHLCQSWIEIMDNYNKEIYDDYLEFSP